MSPVATLSNDEAVDAVLGAADELFYARGVNAVTMAELRDASGVSLRRLYQLYPTKGDVVAAWLEDRHVAWMRNLVGNVDRRVAAGDEPLDALFGFLEEWIVATDFRGCGFINTHAGAVGYTDAQRELVRAHKASVEEYLTALAPDVGGLVVLVDGAIVQASIQASVEPVRLALDLAQRAATGVVA